MNSNKYNFQKLSPIKNAELKIYADALEFVFQEDDLKNVAITGPYSAGKSSVLETYKNEHPEISFLHISLAHFESVGFESVSDEVLNNSKDADTTRDNKNSDAALEGKILNQLIHQIDPEKIPQTHFKVKRKVSTFKMSVTALLVTLSIVLATYIFGFSSWHDFVQNLSSRRLKTMLTFTTYDSSVFIGGVSCIAILMYALYSLIKVQYNRNMFKKVSVQGNDIEIFADADESYFDKYLNEVLYLFENANAQAIVFEDMDRFNSNQIFEKLREINFLINKKSDKVIRFFYLLRDDIFTSKDRTKFFDFIIPVIPVIDGSNSYDQFIDHLKKGGIFEDFNENFLQGLSLYIDDMRILKNIYNEYVIYHDRIQSTELNCNKLLAIVSYKNIFPRDFSDLQLGRGFVHNLFANKSSFIESELRKLDIKIQEKQQRIQDAENELCNKVDELDAIYFTATPVILDVNGNYENQYASRASFIQAMKNNPGNVYCQQSGYGNRYQFDFQGEYNKLSQNAEYTKRKQAIETKSSAAIEKIINEISELLQKKTLLESKKLCETINKENISDIFSITFTNEIGEEFSYNDVKSSPYFPLIKFLIRNGFIDETYSDYMTYFYEHSLSRVDKIFLRSVTDEVAKEFTYKLKDPTLVVSRLRDVDFDHEEILNFDLLVHLLESRHTNLIKFINQLRDQDRFDFVLQFWSIVREKPAFIKSLNHAWPIVFKGILSDVHFSENQKQQYAIDTLYYSPAKDIRVLNIDDCLTTYISDNERFLNIDAPDIPVIISKLSLLNVKFKQIIYESANLSLFKAVYEAELYQMNIRMILLILEKVYDLPENEDYKHRNYTLVVSKPRESLVKYVRTNIEQYIEIVLDNCESIITDDENAALEIINNSDISSNHKSTYIEYLQTTIEKLDSVLDQELWSALLQHRNVRYSEHNVLQYYFNSASKWDAILIEFINSDAASLSFDCEKIRADFGGSETDALREDIILCDNLLDEKYEIFIKGFDKYYEEFSIEGISNNKLKILIKHNIIYMNEANLKFMRENYQDQLVFFICSNIVLYVTEVINEDNFELSELVSLLEKDIEDTYKLKLLGFTSDPISVRGKRYSESIKLHILRNNLQTSDIPYLISSYDQESSNLKIMISNIGIEYIDQIIRDEYEVPYNLLIELLGSDEIEVVNKNVLLLSQLIILNEGQATACLHLLGMSDVISLFSGKWPKLEKTDDNEKILTIFKTKGWISGFEIDKRDPNYFRARGRRTLGGETELPIELL